MISGRGLQKSVGGAYRVWGCRSHRCICRREYRGAGQLVTVSGLPCCDCKEEETGRGCTKNSVIHSLTTVNSKVWWQKCCFTVSKALEESFSEKESRT